MTIALKMGHPIKVRTSLQTSFQKIEAFLLQKENWIERHMLEFARHAEKFPEKKLAPSETFPFLGEMLSLKLVPTPINKVFFSRHNHFLHLHLPEKVWSEITDEMIQDYFPDLQKFYRREAEKLVRERIKVWSQKMNLYPKALKFRNQRTRWGSCTSKGSIQINWRLIGAPLEVIDYILIHELSHLKHLNHSEDFWSHVEKYCPDYRKNERWLRDNQNALDFLKQK